MKKIKNNIKCPYINLKDKVKSNGKLEQDLKESIIIEKEYKEGKRTGYNNVNEMIKSILN